MALVRSSAVRTFREDTGGGGGGKTVDDATETTEAAPFAESGYVTGAVMAVVAGVVLGTLIHDNVADSVSFVAPTGIGIFALFYILAQAIERLHEPLAPFIATAEGEVTEKDAEGKPKKDADGKDVTKKERVNQLRARGLLEKALASGDDKKAANAKRTADQVRANLRVLVYGTSAMLGMLGAGYLKARLLTTVGVTGIETWLDIAITGLVVAGGTKALHELISNVQAAKEEKQDPEGTE